MVRCRRLAGCGRVTWLCRQEFGCYHCWSSFADARHVHPSEGRLPFRGGLRARAVPLNVCRTGGTGRTCAPAPPGDVRALRPVSSAGDWRSRCRAVGRRSGSGQIAMRSGDPGGVAARPSRGDRDRENRHEATGTERRCPAARRPEGHRPDPGRVQGPAASRSASADGDWYRTGVKACAVGDMAFRPARCPRRCRTPVRGQVPVGTHLRRRQETAVRRMPSWPCTVAPNGPRTT